MPRRNLAFDRALPLIFRLGRGQTLRRSPTASAVSRPSALRARLIGCAPAWARGSPARSTAMSRTMLAELIAHRQPHRPRSRPSSAAHQSIVQPRDARLL